MFLLCACLLQLPLLAQVEINVKLNSRASALQAWLDAQTGREIPPGQAERALLQQHAFVADIRFVQPLSPRPASRRATALEGIYSLRFAPGRSAAQLLAELSSSPAVEWVEENRQLGLDHLPPSPPSKTPRPGLLQLTADPPADDSIASQWYHRFIRTFEAWKLTRGSNQVRIGVIDTGLDYTHPEFEGQLALNAAEDLNGNGSFEPWPANVMRNGLSGDFDGQDNDGNGYADDVIGYDFTHQPRSPFGGDYLFEDPDPLDENNHGTLVSGIIAARADNGWGGAGIAPDCRLVALRAFSASGIGEDDDIARAIVYATDNGIRILNFSFGDIYPSQTLRAAIQYAFRRGVVMIASAGNGTGDELHYPSGFNEVISVSATAADLANNFEFLWPLSSYGVTVDLAAPGSGIFTSVVQDTAADGTIKRFDSPSGTSTAAPMVTATVGLLFSLRNQLSPQQVRGILTSSADDISDEGWDHFTGAGRLNVERALRVVGASNVEIVSPDNDGGSAADTVYVVGTVLDPEFSHYQLDFQAGVEGAADWTPIVSDQRYQTFRDTLARWYVADLPEGEYTLRLQLAKTNGSTAEDRIRFLRDLSPPETQIIRTVNVWDDQLRKMLFVFRASDQARHVLHLRPKGSTEFTQLEYDRITRNGEFLLGTEVLSAGEYEYFIQSTNYAGLTAQTPLQTFYFEGGALNTSGLDKLRYHLPMGRMINQTFDFDADGLREVVMTEFDDRLSLSRLKFFEYQGGSFSPVDSLDFKPVLIAKDVADADGDGLLELLCSVNDSTYILEQAAENEFPKTEIFKEEGNERFAARFADTDEDGSLELIMKDFEHYYIYERNGDNYEEVAKLENVSPDNSGSNAPRVLVSDFDMDGKTEIVYQDFDGDLLVYEHVSGNEYAHTFTDTTYLIKEEAGSYLTQGDFDGDGQQEWLVALHTSNKRNDDFEYTPLYWWIRIFKSQANDQYEVVWETYMYDVDNSNFNAATAGNLDEDPADEIVLTTFPRTYLIDYTGTNYEYSWFMYGSLATHHLIADLNENGIAELGLGLGDTTVFYEKRISYKGPQPVTSLEGSVLGPNSTLLQWQPVSNANEYLIYRGILQPGNNTISFALIDSTQQSSYIDAQAAFGHTYLYLLRSKNPALTPQRGEFDLFQTNFAILRPHPNVRLDSVQVAGPRQLEAFFDQPVVDRKSDKSWFKLNNRHTPSALTATRNRNRLLITFAEPFQPGFNQLVVDTRFTDAENGRLDPATAVHAFTYEEEEENRLILTQWEAEGDKAAVLHFNFPLTESALDSSNYELAPYGKVLAVAWASDAEDAVKVQLEDARIGALGYAVSITVKNVCAVNEVCIGEEGNTATFSSHKDDLSEVFAYPNPVRPHQLFEGMRFANLTRQAKIKIYTLSGRLVNELEETDGDGGVQWDMRDKSGRRIAPGIYLYHVTTEQEGVEEVLRKFSVV
ncbi:MAG: T9SS C-terminal target domain-containing protein, partial [Bacteroidetes bacterium]